MVGRTLPKKMLKLATSLRRDPEAARRMARKLAGRVDDQSVTLVAEAARALEPVLTRAQRAKPSKLTELGLKGTSVLGALAGDDETSGPLARLAGSKTIGIVFVDIVDFTTFTANKGDEAAIMLLAVTGELVDKAVSIGRGLCVKRLGDGFLLAFPSPSQAIRAAMALESSAARSDIHLRIAVHAGHPTVEEDDLLGHDVNLAARLLDHCRSDEVLVTDEAKRIAERRLRSVSFGNRRPIRIRGISPPVVVHSPSPRRPSRRRT